MKNDLKELFTGFEFPNFDTNNKKFIAFKTQVDRFNSRLSNYESKKKVPPLELVYDLFLRFQEVRRNGTSIGNFEKTLLRNLDLIFCYNGKPMKPCFDTQFTSDLLSYLKENNSFRLTRKLIVAMLRDYDFQNPLFFPLLIALKNILSYSERLSARKLFIADQQFKILSHAGLTVIVDSYYKYYGFPSDFRDEVGISGDLAGTGIGKQVIILLSRNIEADLIIHDTQWLDKYLSYVASSEKLVASDTSQHLATALLRPFKAKDPTSEVRDKLIKFFDKYFGDPRSKTERWSFVDQELKQVLLRWKVGLTLKAFFGIIEYAAKTDPQADRMWRFRKKFWNAYLENNNITEAWVLLGSLAYSKRDVFLEKDVLFGRLSGGQANHSAILIKIGSLTICEWSHSGSVRIWRDGNKALPILYKDYYHRDDLVKGADFELSHVSSEKSGWQDTVHDFIYGNTWVRLERNRYFDAKLGNKK